MNNKIYSVGLMSLALMAGGAQAFAMGHCPMAKHREGCVFSDEVLWIGF